MRRLVSAAPVQSLSSRSASVRSTGGGSTMMLKLAVFLTLVTVCFTQPPVPKIAESFTSSGGAEVHDTRGTFFGTFVIDRDQSKNEGVENSTFKVGDVEEHYEYLERYDTGDLYTLRYNGSGDVHCQLEKISGNLPMFWGWLALATYKGNRTFHEVVYDEWEYITGGVDLALLVPVDDPNTPRFFERKAGHVIFGFDFKFFMATTPPESDFTVPSECKSRQVPLYKLKSSL